MTERAQADGFDFLCDAAQAIEWQGPIGDCGLCDRAVIDFSALTACEAEAARVAYAGRRLCAKVSLLNGRVQHAPRRFGLRTMVFAVGLGLGGLALASCDLESTAAASSVKRGSLGTHGVFSSHLARMQAAVELAIQEARTLRQPPTPPMEPEAYPIAETENTPVITRTAAESAMRRARGVRVPPKHALTFVGMTTDGGHF